MKNLIFLDYDGVLNSRFYFLKRHELIKTDKIRIQHYKDDFDPKRIKILKEICDKTNSYVVVISSWRGNIDAQNYLISKGIPIIGITPRLGHRGKEIETYLESLGEQPNYIILDDETSEYDDGLMSHVICTKELFSDTLCGHFDYYEGLQNKHVKMAIGMLGGQC